MNDYVVGYWTWPEAGQRWNEVLVRAGDASEALFAVDQRPDVPAGTDPGVVSARPATRVDADLPRLAWDGVDAVSVTFEEVSA